MPTRREEELEEQLDGLKQEVAALRNQNRTARSMAFGPSYEYKSEATWNGLPIVHICQGPDPETGRPRVARGVIAIGNIAVGLVAVGGLSLGVVAVGGLSLGLLSLGGVTIGLLLGLGGVCFGGIACGGVAIGGLALGGVALGYVAIGATASGVYAIGGEYSSLREFQQLFSDPNIPGFIKSIARLFEGASW